MCSYIFTIAAFFGGIGYFAPSFIPSIFAPIVKNAPLLAICGWFGMTAVKGMSASGAFEIILDTTDGGASSGEVIFSKLYEKRMPEISEVVRTLAARNAGK